MKKIDYTQNGNNELFFAVCKNDFERVKKLIAEGFDVNHRNDNGDYPINFAFDLEMRNLLLVMGAVKWKGENGLVDITQEKEENFPDQVEIIQKDNVFLNNIKPNHKKKKR